MSYVAYIPDHKKYKDHFEATATRKRPKDFYVVRPNKVGHGSVPVVTVTPTEGDVAKAKADIQRERDEYISDTLPVLSHLAPKRQKKNTSAQAKKKTRKN